VTLEPYVTTDVFSLLYFKKFIKDKLIMNKKILSLMTILICIMYIFIGRSSRTGNDDVYAAQKITVTDTLGRQVEVNSQVRRVVAIGPGTLRLCCYFLNAGIIAGIEKMDKDTFTGKPYVIANPSFAYLPVIGPGGPNNSPDPEKIISVKPEVIFSTYSPDKSSADNLQSKTGIPVVVLGYGKISVFDPAIYTSIKLIGKMTGMDQKADELINYMEKCREDLYSRTKDIPDDKKPAAYVGGLGMKGVHGIESTQGNYSLFNVVHAKNVVDETGRTGSVMIDKEKLIQWNPEKIFIDASGIQMIKQDYKKNLEFYNSLSAVKNGELYSLLPYNFYTTNIDTAIADAYYIGKVLYPDRFKDIDPGKKADEIYKTLLGKELYSHMVKEYNGFKKLTLQ
jgi:iron complex transport system substrate-binding protein